MSWTDGSLLAVALIVAVGTPLRAQELLKLRPISPVASWQLNPDIGVPEDSLTSVGRGVWIHDIQVGTGAAVGPGDELSVHYVGLLTSGKIFSATQREPYVFVLGSGRVIAGWEDGIPGMKVGGRRQLLIPGFLGYGAAGDDDIPPDANLVFDVTLVDSRQP